MNDPITVNDGKYTFFMGKDGLLDCLRHGEPWPAFRETGGHLVKSTLALYHELLLARETRNKNWTYRAWAEAFAIFAKYEDRPLGRPDDVSADHYVVYAGPPAKRIEKADKARLDELGWFPCEEHECWKRFT